MAGITIRSTRFQGPLPPPAVLVDYDQALPGLGERIVRMAEKEGDHRRSIERSLLHLSGWGLASAFTLSIVALAGGFVLLWQGKTLGGLAPVVLALGGLITTFILNRDTAPPADVTHE